MKFWEQAGAKYIHKDHKTIQISENQREAAHAILFCEKKDPTVKTYVIMMQLRFDGTIGFPGGYVHEDNLVNGLNRELEEEVGLDSKYNFTESNYFGTWIHKKIGLVDHFYVKKYKEKDLVKIEENILKCKDWGGETLGLIRVPLDKTSATANFFKNNFVGNAREQLIRVLLAENILDQPKLEEIWTKMKQ